MAKPHLLNTFRATVQRWLAPSADTPPSVAAPPVAASPVAQAASPAPVLPPLAPATLAPPRAPATPATPDVRTPRPLLSPGADGVREATSERHSSPPAQPGATGDQRAGDARILLVEDNVVNQKLALIQLQRLGCVVDVAGDGQQALALLAKHAYALILMDCNMPVMDGFEATRIIRAREAVTGEHLPIVAVTANALMGDRDRCLAVGMDDYLPKPVRFVELQQKLAQWLSPSAPTPVAAIPAAPPQPTAPARFVLDEAQIEALRALETPDEPNVLHEVLDEFRTVSSQLVVTLQRALTERDTATLYETAHSLKSCSAYVGAAAVSARCAEVEAITKTRAAPLSPDDTSHTARLVLAIDEAHKQTMMALTAIEARSARQEVCR